ncbi:hypothetical protein [Pseudodesulfovibrio indicus]|uniref:hypothetical protein n=1 Tax=Pseudodesulfovibrio indicus TaxID=1716143 RepID=UPI002930F1ED|nr:hypothetical protein [Pseudodesulfovibrio indicus]
MNDLIAVFQRTLPPILWRHRWASYRAEYGLPLASGTMQNLDSAGKGPEFGMFRGRVYYTKDAYLKWLAKGEHRIVPRVLREERSRKGHVKTCQLPKDYLQ